jgi:hypothetical protein
VVERRFGLEHLAIDGRAAAANLDLRFLAERPGDVADEARTLRRRR